MRVVLISTYELGRQPFGLASAAAWLGQAGHEIMCLDLAVEKRIVEKSGAWFAYAGERLGQGRENAKQFLKDNPETFKAIEDRVRRELGMVREAEPAPV